MGTSAGGTARAESASGAAAGGACERRWVTLFRGWGVRGRFIVAISSTVPWAFDEACARDWVGCFLLLLCCYLEVRFE